MKAVDLMQLRLRSRLPFDYQAVYCSTLNHRADDSATMREFGIVARPLDETIADQIEWMIAKGYLASGLRGTPD